jgi:2',3'-cyclic-nucleotide 2'-phosphodiesterase (5'-nucleotidase family)
MKKESSILFLLFSFFQLTSCSSSYQSQQVEFRDYRINESGQIDTSLKVLLQPYSDSVNRSMNIVIANLPVAIEKKQPSGTMNNLVADVLLQKASAKFGQHIDAGFVNYGGLRLPQIPAGPLTKGKIYELSPFDNTIVVMTVKGEVLQQFLDLIASRGGWPVSGISFTINNNRATEIKISGKDFDVNSTYTIATLDYIANGGDNASMLSALPHKDIGYLFRDALIGFFSEKGNNVQIDETERIKKI